RANRLAGFQTIIEGMSWDNLEIIDNIVDITTPGSIGFLNKAGGPRRIRGYWRNHLSAGVQAIELSPPGDTTGFDYFFHSNPEPVTGHNQPLTKLGTWTITVPRGTTGTELVDETFRGLLHLVYDQQHTYGAVWIRGSIGPYVDLVADPNSQFSVTPDTPDRI